jgi:hypothetical protein
MKVPKSIGRSLMILTAAWVVAAPASFAADDKKPKPSITVRSNPNAGFSPLRIVVTAELKGGTNDYEEFYCPSIEWTWGDDTRTHSSADCDPYQAGKSEIQRRYTTSKVFQTAGEYRVEFRLKQKDKVVGSGSTTVQVRPGVRDGGQCC